jgi:hypothetical protein
MHRDVFRLAPPGSIHSNWLNSTQSNSCPLLLHRGDIASVFLHKRPHLVGRHVWGFYCLHLGIMNLLCPMTGSTNDADNRVGCQSTRAADASQTAAFTVGLQYLANLLWANVTMIVEGIEAFVEGLSATRAKIPLNSSWHPAVLMPLQVST